MQREQERERETEREGITDHVKDLIEGDAELDLDTVRRVHDRPGMAVVVEHQRRQETLLVSHARVHPEVRVDV